MATLFESVFVHQVDSVVVLPSKEEIKKESKSTFGVTELSPGGFDL